jgi:hypothetical protein
MQVLLISDDGEVREKARFALEGVQGATVEPAATYDAASALIKARGSAYDVMVCDIRQGSVQDLESFLHVAGAIPCVYCVDAQPERQPDLTWNLLAIVPRTPLDANLTALFDRLVTSGKIARSESPDNFCRIRTKLLLSVCPLKGDIFIRLNEQKHVKLFHEGDHFELSDMEKYTHRKGIDYLYIRKEQCREFIEKYNADLEKKLGGNLSLKEAAQINDSIHETVQEMGLSIGFTKDVQVLVKTQMRITLKSMGKAPRLADLLAKFEGYGGQYIASHSTRTGYFACALASHLEWGSESTFQKLNYASFLHDITLRNPELAACQTMEDFEKGVAAGKFTERDRADFKSHATTAAQVARGFLEIPPDVDAVIIQHHERPDGKGFPRGLGQVAISPLAAVFIVAHKLAEQSIVSGKNLDVRQLTQELRKTLTSSQFRKVIGALEQLDIMKAS